MASRIVPLGELCDLDRRGLRPDEPDAARLPLLGVENVDSGTGAVNLNTRSRVGGGKSTSFRFDERHVLYAKLRPYLNKVATPEFAGRCSTELVPLLPRPGVDRDFLAYLLRRGETVAFVMSSVTGSRMPRADMKALMSMPAPLPSLDEQRRIVDILNRAARIETLRRRAADRLREFVPALFVRMFGDPVENPMGWQVRPLADLVQEFRYGTSRKCYDAADSEDALPVLRIPNVIHGGVDWTNLKFTSLRGEERKKLKLARGDILFVRTNGNPEYIGRCAVFSECREAAYASYLIRARLKRAEAVDPEYVSAGLALPTMRQILLRLTRTTAGNYNISTGLLGGIRIPLPPFALQRRYTEMVKAAGALVQVGESSTRIPAALLESLMSRLLQDRALAGGFHSLATAQRGD